MVLRLISRVSGFEAIHYGVSEKDGIIDYDMALDLAKKHKPKLIIAGCSSYPRFIDFSVFRRIADEVGAILLIDMATFCRAGCM